MSKTLKNGDITHGQTLIKKINKNKNKRIKLKKKN